MLKRKFSGLGELGSMMIEAMAMLGLISMVTPIVYKKAAERNMEIQDVNAASQMRNLIKGLDEYVLDNYGKITRGEEVKTKCKGNTPDYKNGFTKNAIEIDIQQLCDYLPFGFLDKDGNVADNKIFDGNYKVIIKRVLANDPTDPSGKKRTTLTGFVVANPKQGDDFPKLRASRISSMVGGNGGFIETSLSTGKQEALGVQGMWGISDVDDELNLSTAVDGAIITSSVSPISHGGTNDDAVLYRKDVGNPVLNTMETTLFMGATSAEGENIENINQAVITAARSGIMQGQTGEVDADKLKKALWIRGGGGAFVDGVLAVASSEDTTDGIARFKVDLDGAVKAGGVTANNTDTANPRYDFEVGANGGLKAAGIGTNKGTDAANPKYRFDVDDDGAFRSSDGKFNVDKDGAIAAAVNGTDPVSGAPIANFTVDKDGNIVTKGNAEIEKDLTVKGLATIGSDNSYETTGVFDGKYELTVNGDAIVKGLLKVLHFKADKVDAGVLRAGTANVESNVDADYALYVNPDKLTVGVDKFTIDKATGDTTMKGGNFLVTNANDTDKILKVDNVDGYTYAKGLRAGDVFSDGVAALEVSNSTNANITMQLKNNNSEIVAFDASGGRSLEIKNDYSRLQKEVGANKAYVEASDNKISMDVSASEPGVNNFELTQSTLDTKRAKLELRRNESIKAFSDDNSPVLYVDPYGLTDDTTARTDPAGKGGVYIRRGVVDLESNHNGDYVKDTDLKFASGKDRKGYVRADMLISKGVGSGLVDNESFYSSGDIGATQYDSYMVNPAYTSVMHDIKLTTRGGARLSDILPDFINKGIYLADNTYKEDIGNWNTLGFDVANGEIVAKRGGTNVEDLMCKSSELADGCPTSPWMGVVPTPQCPPGYEKVIQTVPYGFNIAQAGVPGQKRKELQLHPDPKEQDPYINVDPDDNEIIPYALYFQKNTWLKTRVEKIGANNGFLGWSVVMGYVYPTDNYASSIWSAEPAALANIFTDGNGYIWNLFPVYYRELEAYSTVYCYFSRKDRTTTGVYYFDPNYVDVEYDQLKNFRKPMDKGVSDFTKRLDDPSMDYKNPW